MLKHLFSLLALLFAFNVEAQRKTYYASDFPDLVAANWDKQLKDIYPTVDAAKSVYGYAYKWWTGIEQQTPESFLQMDVMPACWNEAEWAGNGTDFVPGSQCNSRNNVDFSKAYGRWMVNVACRVFQGTYTGAGTTIGGAPPTWKANASTELIYDAPRWIDPAPIRAVILSTNWGSGGTYLESIYLAGFRIEGRAPGWLTGVEQHGVALRMLGETAVIDRLYITNNNGHGLWINGAGPGEVRNITSFDNNLAGLYYSNDKTGGTAGNSLGALKVGFLSCDNNAWAVLNRAGGAMDIGYIKSETGLSNTRNKPFKGQVVIEAHGWTAIKVALITDAVHGAAGPAFVFNSTANTSRFKVDIYEQVAGGSDNEGRSAMIADVRAKKVYRTAQAATFKNNAMEIVWSAIGTSTTVSATVPVTEGLFGGSTRLGIASTYAGYDYAAGTPPWNPAGGTVTPPVTPPCAYTYSPWGLCSGGKKSRTVIGASPNPCAGTPVLDTVCVSTSAKYTYTSTSGIAANTCVTLTTPATNVTRARITLDLPALPTGYAKIMGDGTTSLQTKDGTGELWWAGTKVGVKLIKGKNTYDIPLPNVTITCLFQQKCPGGGALVGTYEVIELY